MASPIRIGILNDMSEGPSDLPTIERWLRICVDDVLTEGRLDRDVEFVHAYGVGLPSGTASAVEHAYRQLVEQDAVLIVGPAIGDNALVATPLAEQHRVATINWAGTERARGEYMFHLQVGSHEDESVVIARHLASLGIRRVGVLYDRSPIGRRYFSFLQSEAEVLGLQIAATASLQPLAEEANGETYGVIDVGVDAIVHLGLGFAAPAVARAVAEKAPELPKAMNTCGMRGYAPEFAKTIEGWAYVDMHADDNTTLRRFRERLGLPATSGSGPAYGYDMGRLVAEGLARSPERTREGAREGLEQVKWLPAAEGHEGTLLGFGHRDRGALHGRYLVLRQWRSGESVQVADAG